MKAVSCRSALAREKSCCRPRCVGRMLHSEDVSAVPAPPGIGREPVTDWVLPLFFAGKRAPTYRPLARTHPAAWGLPCDSQGVLLNERPGHPQEVPLNESGQL